MTRRVPKRRRASRGALNDLIPTRREGYFFIMLYMSVVLLFIFVNVICDVNYFFRTLFTVVTGRFNQKRRSLLDVTTIYGIGTFRDCDTQLKHVRVARLVRELDMARYHYYDTTGVYQRGVENNVTSLQGCTLTVTMAPVPLFRPYKINTKLVYWDDRSLFLEHEVITLHDDKRRCFFLSRQHAMSRRGQSSEILIKGLPGSETVPTCPEYINEWLNSMKISSSKLR